MAFNSLLFMGFLAAVCVVSYAIPARFRYIWLLLASYGFYLYDEQSLSRNLPALGLMVLATFVSFYCALLIQQAKTTVFKRVFLIVSLLGCLGLLLAFKYLDFVASTFWQLLGWPGTAEAPLALNWVLPLGISYYTLQTVSYTMDVYRGQTPERNLLIYALFVSFFPGIVTGPINRAGQMLPQYRSPAAFNYSSVAGGLFRIIWGVFKKMVIADNIALITSTVFIDPESFYGPHHAVAILLFAYQLYADFSGSCDIAIGAAQMLGFTFMENFARPFAAKTFQDLWRRWHISLTSFFRDYMYIPLGGNRVGQVRWVFNTLLVFTVSGLWHGASLGYVLWGFLSGLVLVLAKYLRGPKDKVANALPLYKEPKVRGVFQRIFVYLLFAGTMAFFAVSLYRTELPVWLGRLAMGWGGLFGGTLPNSFAPVGMSLLMLAAVAECVLLVEIVEWFAIRPGSTIGTWIRTRSWYVRWPLYYGVLILLLVLGAFGRSNFIYQQY